MASVTPVAAAVPQLNWQSYANATGFQCATASVPLDYHQPDGQQIQLAVIRAWQNEPCAQWPWIDPDRYTGPFNKAAAPILLLGVQNDPATPYPASVSMSTELADARLLTVSGGGHTTLLNKSDCADSYIDQYLIDSALPPPGTVCAQNAQPF